MTRLSTPALLLLLSIGILLLPATTRAEEGDAAKPKAEASASDEKPAAKADSEDAAKEESAEQADADDDSGKKNAEKADKKKTKKKKSRKTAEVEEKPLRVEVAVDGVFVSRNMTPVALRPEAWSSFKIEEIVPHGARVREGEVLVRFDADKLEQELADLELSGRLSDLSIRKAEQELPRLEKSLEMSLADAEQSHERTNEDYDRYREEDRDRIVESAKMSLKRSRQQLDYVKDELNQLEKMYEADDLTEETEEIILTRTRQQLEFAEYYYELAKIRHDDTLGIYLPRADVDNREILDRVELSLQRAKLSSQIDLNRARYELEQQKARRDKSRERHAKLTQDRGLMEFKAPADGVVYYGSCTAGKWGDMASMLTKLKPHKTVPSGTVMMTIVDQEPMYLLATVAEKARPSLEPGQPAKIRPAAEDAESLDGSVASVSAIPVASGKFALEVDLTDDDLPEWLVPGMSGKIKVTTYSKSDALVVNKKAVHAEEDDEDKRYVWLVEGEDDDQAVSKRRVEVGKTKGDVVEILDGLDEGDVVSLEDESEKDDD